MKYIKLSTVLDTVLWFLLSLLITISVIFRKIRPLYLKFSVCLISSTVISFVIFLFLIKKDGKKEKEKRENLLANEYLYAISVMPKKEKLSFLRSIFVKANIPIISRTNYLILAEKYYVYPLFLFEDVTATNVLELYGKLPNKTAVLVVFSNTFSSYAETVSEKLNGKIILIGKTVTLSLMKKYDVFPKIDDNLKPTIKKLTGLIDNLKIKKTAKRFLFSGCALLILSLITFYPLYYIVLGSISLTVSAIIYLFGQKPLQKKNLTVLPFLNQ